MICYQIYGVGTAETNSYQTLSYKFSFILTTVAYLTSLSYVN